MKQYLQIVLASLYYTLKCTTTIPMYIGWWRAPELKSLKIVDNAVVLKCELHFYFVVILEQCGTILYLTMFHPMMVNAKSASIDHLSGISGIKSRPVINANYLSNEFNLIGLDSNRVQGEHLGTEVIKLDTNQTTYTEYCQLESFSSVEFDYRNFLLWKLQISFSTN